MTANPIRGEVSFEHDEKEYGLRYSTNELVLLEEVLGNRSTGLIFGDMFSGIVSVRDLRALVWAGLTGFEKVRNGKRRKWTLAQAGDLISEVGMTEIQTHVGEALRLGLPGVFGGTDADSGDDAGVAQDAALSVGDNQGK